MSCYDEGGPAFPSHGSMGEVVHHGMTLRDYFAAHAPEPCESWHGGQRGLKDLIEWRWCYADAMLKARQV